MCSCVCVRVCIYIYLTLLGHVVHAVSHSSALLSAVQGQKASVLIYEMVICQERERWLRWFRLCVCMCARVCKTH
jgi:hypothetical protein